MSEAGLERTVRAVDSRYGEDTMTVFSVGGSLLRMCRERGIAVDSDADGWPLAEFSDEIRATPDGRELYDLCARGAECIRFALRVEARLVCYDCGFPVSITSKSCANCGSRDRVDVR
jgi:hypothetical protein